jgi:hypothetical protein
MVTTAAERILKNDDPAYLFDDADFLFRSDVPEHDRPVGPAAGEDIFMN